MQLHTLPIIHATLVQPLLLCFNPALVHKHTPHHTYPHTQYHPWPILSLLFKSHNTHLSSQVLLYSHCCKHALESLILHTTTFVCIDFSSCSSMALSALEIAAYMLGIHQNAHWTNNWQLSSNSFLTFGLSAEYITSYSEQNLHGPPNPHDMLTTVNEFRDYTATTEHASFLYLRQGGQANGSNYTYSSSYYLVGWEHYILTPAVHLHQYQYMGHPSPHTNDKNTRATSCHQWIQIQATQYSWHDTYRARNICCTHDMGFYTRIQTPDLLIALAGLVLNSPLCNNQKLFK